MDTCLQAMEGNLSRLLEIGRLQSGGHEAAVSDIDLADLLARLKSVYALQAVSSRIDLDVDAVPAELRWARSNATRLFEMLSNLLHNALKFTQKHRPDGGGRVAVRVRRLGETILVSVEDNGPGIAPADHARIFEEYVQIGNSERDHRKGYGLGLAVVRQMADSLAGHDVRVESTLGAGARFVVSLPLGTEALAEGGAAGRDPAADAAGLAGRLVLVIEDDAMVRDALVDTLLAWGVEVEVAASVDEAQALLRDSELLYDAIVTDWRLPEERNGGQVVRMAREAAGMTIPALVVTGELIDDRVPLALPPATTLLRKPIGWPELRRALRDTVARSDAMRETLDQAA